MKGMNWVLGVAEWGVIALFAVCARQAFAAWRSRNGRESDGGRALGILLSAAIYAWIFEDLNVRRGGGRGAYSYNDHFSFFIDQVPLFIVLAWAVILWTSMRFSDAANAQGSAPHEYSCDGPETSGAAAETFQSAAFDQTKRDSSMNALTRQRLRHGARLVASDAALAVLLDISFDATAIRHNFWFWHGVKLDEAWFGVPAGNFFGWLLVSLCFAGLTRALSMLFARQVMRPRFDSRGIAQQMNGAHFSAQLFGVPVVAFALYRGLESALNFFLLLLGASGDRASLIAFFVLFCLTVLIAKAPRGQQRLQFSAAQDAFHRNAPDANAISGGFLARAIGFGMRLLRGGDIVFWVRSSFHAFAVIGLLMLPWTPLLERQSPALLGIAGLVCVLDGLSKSWLKRAAFNWRTFNR